MARGAKSRGNLKRGGSPGRPKKTDDEKKKEKLAQQMAQKLLTSPNYVAGLKERLESGKCQPGVEVAVWHYAFGKPPETIETKQVVPVRIQHEYSEDK
jgi:hypothetical protein